MCMIKKTKQNFTAYYVSVIPKCVARDQNSDFFSIWCLLIHTSVAMHRVHQRPTHNNSSRVSRQLSNACYYVVLHLFR